MIIFCFILTSFCPQHRIDNYIKKFTFNIGNFENQTMLKEYFPEKKNDEIIELYFQLFDDIRININFKNRIVIEEVELRVYKVSQEAYFFYFKLKEDIDNVESVLPVRKGDKIVDWI